MHVCNPIDHCPPIVEVIAVGIIKKSVYKKIDDRLPLVEL